MIDLPGIRALLAVLFLVGMCLAQEVQRKPTVDELITDLGQEQSALQAVASLAEHGSDPRTVPALRSTFLNSTAKLVKQSIALSMLRLKVDDQIYFDYLASFASEAVDNNPPPIFVLKENGDFDSGRPNPDFEEWCRIYGKNPQDEAALQMKVYLQDLMLLGAAHDSRSAPIFRKGLGSNNPLISNQSVYGLACLQDPKDIEQLIEAAGRNKSIIGREFQRALATCYRLAKDRAAIADRLRGTPFYEPYLRAIEAADQIEKQSAARKKS